MADVFVSYSRRDAAGVRRLVDALEARGLSAWVDWEGIPPSAEWLREILGAIEGADAFVYVITPDAVGSEICGIELRHALQNHKRILPLLVRPVPAADLPPDVGRLHWIDFTDDERFDTALGQLIDAVRTDPEVLRLHTRLLTRAVQWRDNREERSLLLRGAELAAAESWVGRPGVSPEPTELQREFIRRSRGAADARRRLIAGLGVATLAILAALGAFSLRERRVSAERALAGLAGQTASRALGELERAHDVALLLAVEAYRIRPTPETVAALQRVLLHRPLLAIRLRGAAARPVALRFDPSGRRIVAGLADSSVVAWNLDSGALEPLLPPAGEGDVEAFAFDEGPARAASGGGRQRNVVVRSIPSGEVLATFTVGDFYTVLALAFSPVDRSVLASANGNTSTGASIWSLETRAALHGPLVSEGGVAALTFRPDGRLLAEAGWHPGVVLWDVASGARAGRVDLATDAPVEALAFGPDGRSLAAGSGGRVFLADAGSKEAPARAWEVSAGPVRSVAFSPDGRWLAAGLDKGKVEIRDLERPDARPVTLEDLEAYVIHLAFSPDGRLLAAADWRSGVVLSDLSRIAGLGRLVGTHESAVRAVAVAPDGSRIASAGWDRMVRLWPAARGDGAPQALAGHRSDIYGLAFTADGASLVSADSRVLPSARGLARIIRWDLRTEPVRAAAPLPEPLPSGDLSGLMLDLPALRDDPYAVALSADGMRLARVEAAPDPGAPHGVRPVIEVRDIASDRSVATLTTAHRHDVEALALDARGKHVASGGVDGRVELWDANRGERVMETEAGATCGAVAFSRDGASLAVACTNEVRLHDLRSGGSERARLTGHGAAVTALAFDPVGHRLASADAGGHWALWDLQVGHLIGRLVAAGSHIHHLAFAPDGTRLLSGDAAGRVIEWDVAVESWRRRACRAANRDLGPEEWQRLLPGVPYRRTCGELLAGGDG